MGEPTSSDVYFAKRAAASASVRGSMSSPSSSSGAATAAPPAWVCVPVQSMCSTPSPLSPPGQPSSPQSSGPSPSRTESCGGPAAAQPVSAS
eukprot:365647-Chlamydomonas_euryale.AAC.2